MAWIYCSEGHDNPADHRFCRLCGAALSSTPANSAIGQLLALRYRILREIGQGGFGRTYLAEDTHRFHERCVLKEFAPQVEGSRELQKAEELFAREAGTLYKLEHPQIPRFRELFRAELRGQARLFLVQDYVEGETYETLLRQRLNVGLTFTEAEVTELLKQLLPVLRYIHAAGVIHRDISPDNLIQRDVDGLPVLIDFGGVKQIAATVASQVSSVSRSGTTRLGKAGYAPEEQMAAGAVSPQSDLYALAVTVLVLLTGKEAEALLGRDRRQWQRLVKLSPLLSTILERMLHPVPHKRFQSAQAVLAALRGQAEDETTRPPSQSIAQPASGRARPANRPADTVAIAPVTPKSQRPARPSLGLRVIKGVLPILIVGAAAIGGWWEWRQLFGHNSDPTPKQTKPAKPKPSAAAPAAPGYSTAEQTRKQALQTRREAMRVDRAFLVTLTDEMFYAEHPDLKQQPLKDTAADASLRADWDRSANELLDRMEGLSPEARARLGSYTQADVEKRRAEVNKLNLSSRALNDLTDARFYALFPDLERRENLLELSIGQIWQAVAVDQLQALKAGKSLVKLPVGNSSEGEFEPVSGRLNAGEGKAYIAKLTRAEAIEVSLKAPDRATQLSIYPPTSKSPALLADSSETQWSGSLPESGLYEIVVVSSAAEPVEYELMLRTTQAIGEKAVSDETP